MIWDKILSNFLMNFFNKIFDTIASFRIGVPLILYFLKTDGTSLLILFFIQNSKQDSIKTIFDWFPPNYIFRIDFIKITLYWNHQKIYGMIITLMTGLHCCIKCPQNLQLKTLLQTYTAFTWRNYNKILLKVFDPRYRGNLLLKLQFFGL